MGTLHTEQKKYLFVLFTFVCGVEGNRGTSPTSTSRNGSIDPSRLSLEAQIKCDFMQLVGKAGHFTRGNNYPLAILSFVHGVESDKATPPSFPTKNKAIDASILLLEVFIATCICRGHSNGSILPMANRYLFVDY